MSTILKALQRLEDEKSAGLERSLDEQVVSHNLSPEPEPNRSALKIGIAALGGVAVAAAGFWLWSSQNPSDAAVATESAPVAAAPVAAAAPEKPVAAPAPAKRTAAEKPRRATPARTQPVERAEEELSEAEAAAIVEVVKRLDAEPEDSGASDAASSRAAAAVEPAQPEPQPLAAKPAARVASRAATTRPAAKHLASAQRAAAAKSADTAPAKPAVTAKSANIAPAEPAPVAKSADAAPAEPAPVEVAAVAPKPDPAPASIPAPVREPEKKVVQRAKLPLLSIEKTIWHPDTERRIAIVKLEEVDKVLRLKEGDAVGPLVVESIKPGSVLFNHDGVEIHYNVGD